MSNAKVNHPIWMPWSGTEGALAKVGTGDTKTSEWFDTSGWTDKVVSFEIDSAGTIDANLTMHVSNQGYYELNHKTCTTDDYVAIAIVDAHTAAILVRKDASDIDDLQRPMRSTRFVIENDQATDAITGFTVTLEGWS